MDSMAAGAPDATAAVEGTAAVSSPRPTIEEQRDEVAREVRQRERLYPEWVSKGRYKPETAEKKLRDIRAAHASLAFLAKYAEGLRLLISILQRVAKYGPAREDQTITDAEAEILLQQPAVRAVVEAFPDIKPEFHRLSPEFCVDGESTNDEDA
jgi:hypothetical protein